MDELLSKMFPIRKACSGHKYLHGIQFSQVWTGDGTAHSGCHL